MKNEKKYAQTGLLCRYGALFFYFHLAVADKGSESV